MAHNKLHPLGKGYVQVYTGNCKGKTTAALGLAFRAMGRGLKTYIGQFMKGQQYGELEAARLVKPHITIEQYGKEGFIHVKNPPEHEDVRIAQEGLAKARKAINLSGKGQKGVRQSSASSQPGLYHGDDNATQEKEEKEARDQQLKRRCYNWQ